MLFCYWFHFWNDNIDLICLWKFTVLKAKILGIKAHVNDRNDVDGQRSEYREGNLRTAPADDAIYVEQRDQVYRFHFFHLSL